MSNDYDDYDEETQTAEHPAERRIREKTEKREADELREKLVEYERKDAVRSAGLELNDKQLKALWAAHEGDATPDALKATAASLGFAKEESTEVPAEEIAAHERVASAATPVAPPPPAASELEAIRNTLVSAPASQLQVGGELYQRTLEAIEKAGLTFDQVGHEGSFLPT